MIKRCCENVRRLEISQIQTCGIVTVILGFLNFGRFVLYEFVVYIKLILREMWHISGHSL